MSRPRILLADDHRIVAEGLRRLLEDEFELVAVVEDGAALVEAARRLRPDVVVADLTMPGLSGLEALAVLRREDPPIRVVMLTMHRDVAYAVRALSLGASGYVLKHAAPEELVLAIRAALAGRTFLTSELAGDVLQSTGHRAEDAKDPVAGLSVRQREVVRLHAQGLTAKEIGAELGISARTVETHKYEVMRSVGLKNSAELIHFALKHGLLEL